MKKAANRLSVLIFAGSFLVLFSCSKSGSNSGSGSSGTTGSSSIFPLAVNNTWNYKLRVYDPATGNVLDTSNFTLAITGTKSINGFTYYQFQNSVDTTTMPQLASITANSLGSIDNAYGLTYYSFFVAGTGDSTHNISMWPVTIGTGGNACEGMNKLYGYYVDTTLVNNDGITYTGSKKNVIETYDCSGNKLTANLYYIKEGVGLVRYSRYNYSAAGKPQLELAWVLESESLH
jgi:hypothetical protein